MTADLVVLCQYVRGAATGIGRERGLDDHIVDDLAQDAIVAMLERDLPRLDDDRPLAQRKRFVRKRVVWAFGDLARALTWDLVADTDVLEEIGKVDLLVLEALREVTPTPTDVLESSLVEVITERAWALLGELPRHQREAIVASIEAGCAEFARGLGVATSTITRRRDKGLAHIRAALEVAYG